ncbi:MAG: efflux RND transporter periplasmic adaptor subunit [Telluria sp.]
MNIKTKVILASLLVAALLAGGALIYQAGKNAGSSAAVAPVTGAAHKKALYWHDPMVPGQRFDKPGKSPFMDMQLVPVYGDEDDAGTVAVSPRMQQSLGMRTGTVTRVRLGMALAAVGSVAYNEREVALIQARSAGYVERLHVRAPLEPVRKGQPLLELFIPDWIAAQEEYLATRRIPGAATDGLLSAAKQRMLLAGMDAGLVRLVETSGKVQPRVTIRSPIGGVVAELLVREGMTVSPGMPLFRVNGVASVWVNAEVPEAAAALVRPGAAVEARTPAFAGKVFTGKVSALLPEVSPTTRTLKARIELANPGGELVPGMFANVTFTQPGGGEVLLVPSEAVIKTGRRSVVMVALGGGRFGAAEVETGAESNEHTEIRKGLEEGQNVVLSGQFLIDSEASLRGAAPSVPQKAAPDHRAQGTLEAVDEDEVTLSHGPVPSLEWGAMTMAFKLPAGGIPPGIAVGDTVSFGFIKNQTGGFTITTITPAKAPGAKK